MAKHPNVTHSHGKQASLIFAGSAVLSHMQCNKVLEHNCDFYNTVIEAEAQYYIS